MVGSDGMPCVEGDKFGWEGMVNMTSVVLILFLYGCDGSDGCEWR